MAIFDAQDVMIFYAFIYPSPPPPPRVYHFLPVLTWHKKISLLRQYCRQYLVPDRHVLVSSLQPPRTGPPCLAYTQPPPKGCEDGCQWSPPRWGERCCVTSDAVYWGKHDYKYVLNWITCVAQSLRFFYIKYAKSHTLHIWCIIPRGRRSFSFYF